VPAIGCGSGAGPAAAGGADEDGFDIITGTF